MHDLLLPPDVKGLKIVLEIFEEQSHEMRSISPSVFFEKVVLNIFRKSLEKHLWQSSYSAYFQTFRYLQTTFCVYCKSD